ncbi:hypothetical protein [Paenibacillus arenosi]|uniref:F5/8 type C domain-containing protein n=1 Tax=Paenibacillus arenosi TaxID=2774142 RepID=A0ABR9AXQ9_9BACL|nr:hypothetical protein [Paenibacillus arenosi]MBD8498873.1 hypothetical protein [Paenibacillus arenosi]
MPVPLTGGRESNRVDRMQIGDYIPCTYKRNGSVGLFSNLGEIVGTELPTAGSANPSGFFYFIKVDEGLFIADRTVQFGQSWLTYHASRYVEGRPFNLGLVPEMTSNTAPYGKASASSIHSSPYPAWEAFNEAKEGWVTDSRTVSGWLEYEFVTAERPTHYKLKAAATNVTSMIKDWNVEAWDGVDWVVVDSRTNEVGWAGSETRLYIMDRPIECTKIRIKFTSNNGQAYSGINQWQLYNQGMKDAVIRFPSGGIYYKDSEGNPSLRDVGLGAFPKDNEWDKYVANNAFNGTNSNEIWHWNEGTTTWVKDTVGKGFPARAGFDANVSGRIQRGNHGMITGLFSTVASYSSPSNIGFRPVLDYR